MKEHIGRCDAAVKEVGALGPLNKLRGGELWVGPGRESPRSRREISCESASEAR